MWWLFTVDLAITWATPAGVRRPWRASGFDLLADASSVNADIYTGAGRREP